MIRNISPNPYSLINAYSSRTSSKKTYTSLGQVSNDLFALEAEYKNYYSEKEAEKGEMTLEELKKALMAETSKLGYTFTNKEPKDVAYGKYYCYIDDSNLEKMAKDPEYRAQIYALMQRESPINSGSFHMKKSNGDVVQTQIVGSVFSLNDNNKAVNGIPYKGSGQSKSITVSKGEQSKKIEQNNIKQKQDQKRLDEKRTAKRNAEKAKSKKAEQKKLDEKLEQKRKETKENDKKLLHKSFNFKV